MLLLPLPHRICVLGKTAVDTMLQYADAKRGAIISTADSEVASRVHEVDYVMLRCVTLYPHRICVMLTL